MYAFGLSICSFYDAHKMNELILLYRSQTSFHIFRTKTNGIIFRITANALYNKLHALSFTDTLFR